MCVLTGWEVNAIRSQSAFHSPTCAFWCPPCSNLWTWKSSVTMEVALCENSEQATGEQLENVIPAWKSLNEQQHAFKSGSQRLNIWFDFPFLKSFSRCGWDKVCSCCNLSWGKLVEDPMQTHKGGRIGGNKRQAFFNKGGKNQENQNKPKWVTRTKTK